jgi:hypothetical protein
LSLLREKLEVSTESQAGSAWNMKKNGFRTEWAKYRASENSGHLENVNGAKLINRYGVPAKTYAKTGLNRRKAHGGETVGEDGWRRERNWDRTFSMQALP